MPINQNTSPYFNDYDETKNFHQTLYKPSLALQARELTQSHNILQTQISRLGNFVLEDGSRVTGGNLYKNFDTFEYVKLNSFFETVAIDVSTWPVGTILTGGVSGAKGEVLNNTVAVGTDPETIYVKYLTGSSLTDGVTACKVTAVGSSYAQATTTASITGGGGSGATADVAVDDTSGKVLAIDVTDSGTGYGIIATTGTVTGFNIDNTAKTITILGGGTWTGLVVGDVVNISQAEDINNNKALEVLSAAGAILTLISATVLVTNTNDTTAIIREAPLITITDSASGTGATARCTLNTAPSFRGNEQVSDGTITFNADTLDDSQFPAGKSSSASVDEGVYYTDSNFVRVAPQSVILDKYSNTPTYNVGFDVDQTIITSSEDSSLLDQAQGSPNFNAPGADRLKITLTLVKKDFDSVDVDDFIPIARFENGVVIETKTVAGLGEIEETLARRTFDESGSYTVRPYPLTIRPHETDPTKLTLALDPGKAFVKGFEHETVSTTFIDIDKSRDTTQVNGGDISAPLGNYILIDTVVGPLNISTHDVVDVHDSTTVVLTNPTSYAATKVGEIKIRQLEYHSGADAGPFVYKLYFYDPVFTGDPGTIKSLAIPVDDQATPVVELASADIDSAGLDSGVLIVFESDFQALVHRFPNKTIKSAKDPAIDTSYTIKKNFSGVAFNGSGIGTVTSSGTETFSGTGVQSNTIAKTNFHLVVTALGTANNISVGDVIEMSAASHSVNITSTTTAVLTTDANGTFTGDVIVTLNLDAEPETTKTLQKNVLYNIGGANQTLLEYDNLFKSDVNLLVAVYDGTLPPRFTIGAIAGGPFQAGEVVTQTGTLATGTFIAAVDSVSLDLVVTGGTFNATGLLTGTDSSATVTPSVFNDQTDIKSKYKFDNGQRDSQYDYGRIQLITTAPTGPDIVVIVNHFTHSFGAGYFTVDSYSNIDYEDIPAYTSPTSGKTVQLRDVLDFRVHRKDDNGLFNGAISILVAAGSLTNVAWADANPDTITITGTTFDLSIVRKGSVIWAVDAADAGNRRSFTVESVNTGGITLNANDVVTANATDTTLTDFWVRDETMEGAQIPVPNANVQVDYSYYLARNDLLYLSQEKAFGLLTGVSAEKPNFPKEVDGAITLYKFKLNPFTFSESDLTIESLDHQRFTMKDIGDMKERLINLEYFTALSLLESETANQTILDSGGNDRVKHGILIDSFQGHGIGDVNDLDHFCAIDMAKKELRPYAETTAVKCAFDSVNSTNFTKTGDILTLPFSTSPYISQTQVSNFTTPVNPFDIANWRGSMGLVPTSTDFFDVDAATPFQVTTTTTTGWWDAWYRRPWNGWGWYWGYWNWGWWGWSQTTQSLTAEANDTESALDHHLDRLVDTGKININSLVGSGDSVPQAVTFDYNGKKVTTTVVPYIAAQPVTIALQAMKPNTRLYPFFDGKDISVFVTPSGGSAGDPIYTTAAGTIDNLVFDIPNDTNNKFLTGEKLVRLIDNNTNNTVTATTFAEAIFYAVGAQRSTTSSIQSTRTEKITNDVAEDTVLESTLTANTKWSALHQTFTVDEKLFPDGLFLCDIDLFFKTKSSQVGFPIKLDIRNTENKYPGQKIVPFSEVVKPAADINTSTDGTTATKFVFPGPVYLLAGETYAVSVNANSKDYLLWTAEVGSQRINSTQKVFKQPYMSALFKAQNTGILVPDSNQMLVMNINRCVYNTATQATLLFNNVTPAAEVVYDAIRVLIDDMNFDKGTVAWAKKTTPVGGSLDAAFSNFESENDVKFLTQQRVTTSANSTIFRALFNSTSDAVSPVIDLDRLAFVTIENRINNDATGEDGTKGGNALARYISRRVVLEDGFDADDLKVFLRVNNKGLSTVQVYFKVLANDDADEFDDKNWVQMAQATLSSVVSTSEDEFVELEFVPVTAPISYTSGAATYNNFKTWAIKIVMLSANSSAPPRVKDLRAIALT